MAIAGLVIAALAGFAGYVAYIKDFVGYLNHAHEPVKMVVDPSVGFGGVPVFALPKSVEDDPVDYLRGGAQTAVDCWSPVPIDKAGHYYTFLRIAEGELDPGRWVQESSVVMADGSSIDTGLQSLARCSQL